MSEKTATRRRFFRRGLGFGGLFAVPALSTGFAAEPAPNNETLKTIQALRSIHGDFSDKSVPADQVEAVIDASVRAANASNMQSYSIVVSRDSAKIQKLTGYRANCLLLYCADYTRYVDVAKHLGDGYNPDGTDGFVTASTNTILAAQTAVIAARSMGIDSLLTNGIHRGDMERIWEILDLPQKSCFPLIALLLGYPRSEPPYRMGRLRGPGLVHYERYHHMSGEESDQMVRQMDDKALHVSLNDDWRQKGYKHYLDWFFKEWVSRNKVAGEGPMSRRLRKSGFIDAPGA